MKLKPEEIKRLETILEPFRNDERTQKMKQFIQHGKITTYEHAESVTKLSYWINKRLHLNADEHVLTVGAFLHDYYLYDWHNTGEGHRLHGFRHPKFALKNAKRDFNVTPLMEDIILHHMFPLVPILPKSKAAFRVSIIDKKIGFYDYKKKRSK